MDTVKNKLSQVWGFAVEKKHILIPIATGVVGALIGAAITKTVIDASMDNNLLEEVVMTAVEE